MMIIIIVDGVHLLSLADSRLSNCASGLKSFLSAGSVHENLTFHV